MKMSSCEKCWNKAGRRALRNPSISKSEHYLRILRNKAVPCTPKEQAGQFWDKDLEKDIRGLG